MMIYSYCYQSPLGTLQIQTSDQQILRIQYLDSDSLEISTMDDICNVAPLQLTINWLDKYFSGSEPIATDLPLLFSGTTFQNRIWKHLLEIPYGQTVTYGQIATVIAQECDITKMSAQAVGQAVGANPINILIPCHRVIGRNGKLTGYVGGLDRKIWLLNHEKAL